MNRFAKTLNTFHVSLRTLFEFAIVVAVFFTAEPSNTSLIIGICVSVTGEVIRIWASGYQRRVSIFFIAGPYCYVRHPRYLGTFLLLLGLCIAGRNFYVVSALLIGITLIYRYYFKNEEEVLRQIAGPEFARYRLEVPAFIPQIIPVMAQAQKKGEDVPKFSFNYSVFRRKRRELDSIFGLILSFGLIYVCSLVHSKVIFNSVLAGILFLFVALRIVYYSKKLSSAS